MGRPSLFSPAEQEEIIKCVKDGETFNNVARKYNCSSTIISNIYKHSGNIKVRNIPQTIPRYSDELKHQVIQFINNGESFIDVTKKFDISYSTIWKWCKENDIISLNSPSIKSEFYDDAINRVKNGESCNSVGNSLPIAISTVHRICKNNNISFGDRKQSTYSKDVKDKCIELLKEGVQSKIISEKFGISSGTISNWKTKTGLVHKPKRNSIQQEKILNVINDIKNGMSYREVGKKYNMSPRTVAFRCKEEGISSINVKK